MRRVTSDAAAAIRGLVDVTEASLLLSQSCRPHCVCQPAIKTRQCFTIFGSPVREQLAEEPSARRRDRANRSLSIICDSRLVDALIARAPPSADQC